MKKESLFKELISDFQNNHKLVKDEYKYIGTGNPLSDILIIGKEAAISKVDEQYRWEIEKNIKSWIELDIYSQNKIESRGKTYNPLYPYKGQILKKDNQNGNWGTSPTWINYQKLYNYIFNTPENTTINFHENIFLTEVNSTPSKKTGNADIQSIEFRKEKFLTSKYIQSFPVVIISGVGYFNIYNSKNEIEKIFNVKFTEKRNAGGNLKQPYWLHWNNDKTKLIINTYQLSINISDNLLKEIAFEIEKSKLVKQWPTPNNG